MSRKQGGALFSLAVLLSGAPALAQEVAQDQAVVVSQGAEQGHEASSQSEPPAYETVVVSTPQSDDPAEARIGRMELESSGGRSMAEALERQPGIYATTGSRGERLLRIRGFEQRQVFMVIDGVPAYIPYDGQLDLGKIPSELVEDVVVLRGTGNLRYGPSGMGGTLSIRTRQPGQGPLLTTRFDAGRGLHLRLSAVHSYQIGPVSYLIGGGVESRDSFPLSSLFGPTDNEDGRDREQSDRLLRHIVGRARLSLGANSWLEATAWHVDGSWGIAPSTTVEPPRYWRMTSWKTTVATLGHRWMPAPRLVLQELFFVSFFDNLLDSYDDATYSTQESAASFHSFYHDLSVGGWVRGRLIVPRRLLWRFEAGLRFERHRSDWAGRESSEVSRLLILGATQLESIVGPRLRIVAAVQAQGEAAMDGAPVAPDADASLALRYTPSERWALGASVGRRSRLPTLRERFSSSRGSGGRIPNPELEPEVALHFGLDASFRLGQMVRVDVLFFDAEIRGLIDQVALGDDTVQFQNLDRARLLGAEALVRVFPLRWLDVEAGYNFLYARAVLPEGQTGPLAYRPSHLARFCLRVRPLRPLTLSTTLRVVGSQDFRDPMSTHWRRLGPYLSWDVRAELRVRRGLRLWMEATNVLDANHQTQYGYPEPGAQYWGGLEITL